MNASWKNLVKVDRVVPSWLFSVLPCKISLIVSGSLTHGQRYNPFCFEDEDLIASAATCLLEEICVLLGTCCVYPRFNLHTYLKRKEAMIANYVLFFENSCKDFSKNRT